MLENILKFTAKVGEETSDWYVKNGTKIEVAEQMALQFLQCLGNLKSHQEAQKQSEPEPSSPEAVSGDQSIEQPPVE